jgi:hypothetical protein
MGMQMLAQEFAMTQDIDIARIAALVGEPARCPRGNWRPAPG